MSLYDDATFIFSAEAAAGHPGRAHALKPVEKLKDTELITDTGFDDSGEWTTGTGWSISGGKAVADGTGDGTGADLKNTTGDLSGKTVKISFEISDYEQGSVRIYFHSANSTLESDAFSGDGIHTITHVVTSGHNSTTGPRAFDNFKGKIDNFSIKEVEVRSLDFEVTRDANLGATRVKADGLIEKGRENLIKYSNTLDGTGWSNTTGTPTNYNAVVSGQSGYDGSTNAWLIEKTTTDNSYIGVPFFAYDGVFTWSVYAKNEGTKDNGLHMYTPYATGYFDLVNGTVDSESGLAKIEVKMEPVTGSPGDTDRWYRCSVTGVGEIVDNDNEDRPRFKVINIDGSDESNGAGGGSYSSTGKIFLQNFQFESGLVATPYIDSGAVPGVAGLLANEPRYDYLTSTNDCPGALVEPERTNLVKNSEYLGDYTTSNATITTNALTSPEGLDNATTINVTSNSGSIYAQSGGQLASVTAETQYTFSFYVKQGTNTENYLAVRDQTAEVFISEDVAYTASSSEWKRIEHTFTTPAGCTSVRLYPSRYDSGGQGTTHLFGIQLEEGPWETSYIPTYGSTVTREDEVFKTPIDTSGVYAQDDFTVFMDYKDFKTPGASNSGLWRFLHRNVTTKSVFQYNKSIGYTSDQHFQYRYASNQADEGANKIAIVYNRDSFKIYINGAENKVDYAVNTTLEGICKIEINYGKSKMTVNRCMVFNRPLTKDEAIALTT